MTTRTGRRPGDQRSRVEIVRPEDFRLTPVRRVRRPPPPAAAILVLGFAALIAIGTVVLSLPIASAGGTWTSPLVALFTATSAVCVTGLVVVDTGTYWSGFGQAAILALIQIGGFGFMTGSTLLLLLVIGRRTSLQDRLVAQAETGTQQLGSVSALVRRIAMFTLAVEGVGAVVLAATFLGHGRQPLEAAWLGLFHAVSAFTNASFDLFGGFRSLSEFAGDPLILATVGTLIVLGGIGFAIVGDVLAKRRWSRLALETKVVLLTSATLLAGGALAFLAIEWGNPLTLGALPVEQRPLNALFLSAALRTAGFSTFSAGGLGEASLLAAIALMFIGGASGSTAGGIKVNTFSVLLVAIVSTARGKPSAEAFGRRVPHLLIYRALAVALLSIALVFLVTFGLELGAGSVALIELLFEATSAFATAGASTGITPALPDGARLMLIVAMFVGRLGPLTLVLALTARARSVKFRSAVETMRIG